MSTRGCDTCGREVGFHRDGCTQPAPSSLTDLITACVELHERTQFYVKAYPSPWARMVEADAARLVNTVHFVAADIERRRIDDEEKARGQ